MKSLMSGIRYQTKMTEAIINMATNAYGRDFWVGQVWRSKDARELTRHVYITDIQNGKAICSVYILATKEIYKRKTRISLKTLATRWELCPNLA